MERILRELTKDFEVVEVRNDLIILTKIDEDDEKNIKELNYEHDDVKLKFKVSSKYVNLVKEKLTQFYC